MKIPAAVMEILAPYMTEEWDYNFPVVQLKLFVYKSNKERFLKHVNAKNGYINKYCKELAAHLGLQKKVTMHIARHTFGYLADRSKVSLTMIQSLYGHSSLGMTERYIQELRQSDEMDSAVDGLF